VGHALAQATFLEKGFLQLPELSVEKEVADADQTDNHIPGDRRVGFLDAFAERRVGRVRNPVQLAKTERIGVLRGPFLKTAHSQEIAVIGQQLFKTGTATLVSLISVSLEVAEAMLPSMMFCLPERAA
jgi:hypothetical protein